MKNPPGWDHSQLLCTVFAILHLLRSGVESYLTETKPNSKNPVSANFDIVF